MAGARDLFVERIPRAVGTLAGQAVRGFEDLRHRAGDTARRAAQGAKDFVRGMRGADTRPAAPTGKDVPSSAFGEFDSGVDESPSRQRMLRGGVNPGETMSEKVAKSPGGRAVRAAGKVAKGAAKVAGPAARFGLRQVPLIGGAIGLYNMATEGVNPQNVADTASGFMPPLAAQATQAGNFALSGENRYRTSIGTLIDPLIDYAAEKTSGIEIGPGGDARRVNPQTPPREAPTTPGPEAAATAAGARPDVAVPAQERLDPRAMLADSRTPIPAGTGAFQRTTPGNVGQPTLVDSRASLRGAPTQVAAGTRFGPIGELAAASVLHAGQERATARAGEAADRAVKLAQLGVTAQNANEERVLKSIGDEVARDSRFAKMDKEEREGIVTQETADLAQRFRRSAAALGMPLGGLTPVVVAQLKTANDFRKSLVNRGAPEFVADFFGDKRFEGDNLFGYVPDSFEEGVTGGWLTMRNGNRIRVDKATRRGTTHWLLPNDPTETDMTAMVAEARKKSKKGAR